MVQSPLSGMIDWCVEMSNRECNMESSMNVEEMSLNQSWGDAMCSLTALCTTYYVSKLRDGRCARLASE